MSGAEYVRNGSTSAAVDEPTGAMTNGHDDEEVDESDDEATSEPPASPPRHSPNQSRAPLRSILKTSTRYRPTEERRSDVVLTLHARIARALVEQSRDDLPTLALFARVAKPLLKAARAQLYHHVEIRAASTTRDALNVVLRREPGLAARVRSVRLAIGSLARAKGQSEVLMAEPGVSSVMRTDGRLRISGIKAEVIQRVLVPVQSTLLRLEISNAAYFGAPDLLELVRSLAHDGALRSLSIKPEPALQDRRAGSVLVLDGRPVLKLADLPIDRLDALSLHRVDVLDPHRLGSGASHSVRGLRLLDLRDVAVQESFRQPGHKPAALDIRFIVHGPDNAYFGPRPDSTLTTLSLVHVGPVEWTALCRAIVHAGNTLQSLTLVGIDTEWVPMLAETVRGCASDVADWSGQRARAQDGRGQVGA